MLSLNTEEFSKLVQKLSVMERQRAASSADVQICSSRIRRRDAIRPGADRRPPSTRARFRSSQQWLEKFPIGLLVFSSWRDEALSETWPLCRELWVNLQLKFTVEGYYDR